jgi:hypothetical protein
MVHLADRLDGDWIGVPFVKVKLHYSIKAVLINNANSILALEYHPRSKYPDVLSMLCFVDIKAVEASRDGQHNLIGLSRPDQKAT